MIYSFKELLTFQLSHFLMNCYNLILHIMFNLYLERNISVDIQLGIYHQAKLILLALFEANFYPSLNTLQTWAFIVSLSSHPQLLTR